MSLTTIRRIEVRSFGLSVPVSAFDLLPQDVGCSLQRSATALRLCGEQPSCELRFRVADATATLTAVEIADDREGRFTRRVLGGLMLRFKGCFDGVIHWELETEAPSRLLIRHGESSYALLVAATSPLRDGENDLVERLLAEARAAWAEYLRMKNERAGHGDASR